MIGAMHEQRLDLDRRIHNQRRANRDTWDILEMRAAYKHLPKDVGSRMMRGWCAATRELSELKARLAGGQRVEGDENG